MWRVWLLASFGAFALAHKESTFIAPPSNKTRCDDPAHITDPPKLLCHGHHNQRFGSCTSEEGFFVFFQQKKPDGTVEFDYECPRTFDTIVTHLHRGMGERGIKAFTVQVKMGEAWQTITTEEYPMMSPQDPTQIVKRMFTPTTGKSFRVTIMDGFGGGGSGLPYFLLKPLYFELSTVVDSLGSFAYGNPSHNGHISGETPFCLPGLFWNPVMGSCQSDLHVEKAKLSNATCLSNATQGTHTVGYGARSTLFQGAPIIAHGMNLHGAGPLLSWGPQCISQQLDTGFFEISLSVQAVGNVPEFADFYIAKGFEDSSLFLHETILSTVPTTDAWNHLTNKCVHLNEQRLTFFTRRDATTWGVEMKNFQLIKHEHSCDPEGTTHVKEMCEDGEYTFMCECDDDHFGDFCELYVDGCDLGPCQHGSICSQPTHPERGYFLWGPNSAGLIVYQHTCNCTQDEKGSERFFGKNCQFDSECDDYIKSVAVAAKTDDSSTMCKPRRRCSAGMLGGGLVETQGFAFTDNYCSSDVSLRAAKDEYTCSQTNGLIEISRPDPAERNRVEEPVCYSQQFEKGIYYLELQVRAFGAIQRRCEEFYISRNNEGDIQGPLRTKLARSFAPTYDAGFGGQWETLIAPCVEMNELSRLSFYLGCWTSAWGVQIQGFKFMKLFTPTCDPAGTERVVESCKNGEHVFDCVCKEGVTGPYCGTSTLPKNSFKMVGQSNCTQTSLGTFAGRASDCESLCLHQASCSAYTTTSGDCQTFSECSQSSARSGDASVYFRKQGVVGAPTADENKWRELASVSANGDSSVEFWEQQCTRVVQKSKDWTIMVEMGNVRDYFKGRHGADLCDVLVKGQNFLWSAMQQGPYISLNLYPAQRGQNSEDPDPIYRGGSLPGVPSTYNRADTREFVSFWSGNCTTFPEGAGCGGCCASQYSTQSIEPTCKGTQCNANTGKLLTDGMVLLYAHQQQCMDRCAEDKECWSGYYEMESGGCFLASEQSTTRIACQGECVGFGKSDSGRSVQGGVCDSAKDETVSVTMYGDAECAEAITAEVSGAGYGSNYCQAMSDGTFARYHAVGDRVLHMYFSDSECSSLKDQFTTRCEHCERVVEDNSGTSRYVTTTCKHNNGLGIGIGNPGPWNQAFKVYVRGVELSDEPIKEGAANAEDEAAETTSGEKQSTTKPPARMYHATAVETADIHASTETKSNLRMFVFGGADEKSSIYPKGLWGGPKEETGLGTNPGTPLNNFRRYRASFNAMSDIWALNWAKRQWVSYGKLELATGASGLMMHTAVYDTFNNAFLIFGGKTTTDIPSGITYRVKCVDEPHPQCTTTNLVDLSDDQWKQPEARYGHVAAWLETSKKMLIFGGMVVDLYDYQYWIPHRVNDLWVYDVPSNIWTQLHSTGNERLGTRPEPRMFSSGSMNGRMASWFIIYGGSGKYGLLDDMWIFDLPTLEWRQIEYKTWQFKDPAQEYLGKDTLATPSKRAGHRIAVKGNNLYLTGGWHKLCSKAKVCSTPPMEMWRFKINADYSPSAWTAMGVSSRMGDFQGHSMEFLETFDDNTFDNKLIVFGGDRWAQYTVNSCTMVPIACPPPAEEGGVQETGCQACTQKWSYPAWFRRPSGDMFAFSLQSGSWLTEASIF